MAAPNLINVSSVYGKSTGQRLTTTLTTSILTCPTDKVLKVNSILAANLDPALGAEITCYYYDNSTSTRLEIANIAIPFQSSLIVVGKDAPIYLEESDRIEAGSAVANTIDLIISYEEMDDA